MSYRRREKIDIESQADFPTLGAAADTVRVFLELYLKPRWNFMFMMIRFRITLEQLSGQPTKNLITLALCKFDDCEMRKKKIDDIF